MRFNRLYIPAFGPFTNLDLVFPDQGSDLHVIYGPNEAGKSSLLRAFRDLLFGIHGQSPDNFVHDYKKLRIGAEITSRAGERFIFQRRKGNKNTLLDVDGNELPDDALGPFLGIVDQEYFSAMFGLSTAELRNGAEELLHGKGEIGNALFSASMGGTPVQLVLAELIEEAGRLFKGRATANVSIRPTTNGYKDLISKSREALVRPEAWEKLKRELKGVEEEKSKLEDEISVCIGDLEWLSRCEDALPTVGRLNEEMRKLENLPLLPEVSSDYVERARTARKAASDIHTEVERLESQIAKLEEQVADCQVSQVVLAAAEILDGLHQDMSVYRVRKNSLIDLQSELAGLETGLRTAMQNQGLTGSFSELENLRMSTVVLRSCEEAAGDLQKALDETDKIREKMEDLQGQIKDFETQLHGLPETDMTHLRDALAAAAGAIESDRTLLTSESEVERLTYEVTELHRAMRGAPKDVDLTSTLPVPAKATIRRFAEEMDHISRDIKSEEVKLREKKEQIESLEAELGRMERRGAIPSEQSLLKAREHRDHGWSIVLAEWKGQGGTEAFVPGVPLEEAFPQAIVSADNIADKLREQADAVAQAEEKRFQITQCKEQICMTEAKIEDLLSKLKDCQSSWEEVWLPCKIKPETPAEMEEWRETWNAFKNLLRKLSAAEEVYGQKKDQVQEATAQLVAVLSESEEKGFTLLYDKAIALVRKGEEASGRRIEINKQLKRLTGSVRTLEDKHARLTEAIDTATKNWGTQSQLAGMPENVSHRSGIVLLQERKELLVQFDSWKKITSELQRIKTAVDEYERAVKGNAVSLGAAGDTIEAQEIDLWDALVKARSANARHEQLVEQIDEAQNTLDERRVARDQAQKAFEELICLGKLETIEELEPLLANLESRDEAQSKIAAFRDTLSSLARGQKVDDFLSRINAEDLETIAQRKDALQRQKQEKETALQTARDALYVLKSQREALLSAGDGAANYRQEAESYAAKLKQDAKRFVRLHLAAHFLGAQIERFRKENQGPLLEKSGQIFKRITRGAFDGLGTDFNADDTPVLVGLRPDKSRINVEGMSDGARDQLYLALRLAALDRHLESHEPMPLILDDLLITFDNDRAAAVLPQLAELGRRTQIFLFTHHDHLVELCRGTLGENAFHLHHLKGNSELVQ